MSEIEKVTFTLGCRCKVASRFTPRLRELGLDISDPDDGDILEIDYKLNINYLGQVADILQTFVEMIDSGAVRIGNLTRDDGGEILIKRVLESLRKIKR